MHKSQENGLKPHFGPFLALVGPFLAQINFFSKIGLRHFSRLQKINEILWWEVLELCVTDGQTDGWTDGRSWFQKDALRESQQQTNRLTYPDYELPRLRKGVPQALAYVIFFKHE